MSQAAITFDFHDTLIHAPAWFQLEVRTLVSAFLQWQAERQDRVIDPGLAAAADRRFRGLRLAIMQHGHELPATRCVATVLAALGLRVSDDDIEEGVTVLMQSALADATPVEGARETVTALATAGVPLAVVSSAVHQPFLEWALARFEMTSAFGAVVSSARSGFYKNRPEIFWDSLNRIGGLPTRSIHVGDSYRFDVQGAAAAGMRSVWLNANGAEPIAGGASPVLTLRTLTGAASALSGLLAVDPG